jgi:hypothetical protein
VAQRIAGHADSQTTKLSTAAARSYNHKDREWLSTHVLNYGDVFRQAAGASRLASILARRAWRSWRVKVQWKGDADCS